MKKLYRSRHDRKIGGVCGGLAEYLNTDSTVIRLITIFLFIFTGLAPMFLAYIIAWIVMPEEPR